MGRAARFVAREVSEWLFYYSRKKLQEVATPGSAEVRRAPAPFLSNAARNWLIMFPPL
jgi:hypothetical protein